MNVCSCHTSRQFIDALSAMWKVNAQGWITQHLGPAQDGLLNPIGEALAARIGRAIDEHLPFHVYLALPVHLEGSLEGATMETAHDGTHWVS